MNARLVRLLAVTSIAVLPATAAAQQRAVPTVARITPYVGYLTFGDLATGPIGTRIANQSTALYGVQAGLDLTPFISLVGNLGYADSNIEVGLPIVGGYSIADSKVLLYDGGLQIRLGDILPLGGAVIPFLEAGAGAIRYEVRAGSLSTTSTNVAGNVGGGVDLQLGRNLGVRLMAKDYIGRFDLRDVTGFDFEGRLTHNIAYSLGLNFGF